MALSTFQRTIPQRLQDMFLPITDDAFSEVLARIVARFETVPRADPSATCTLSRSGMSRGACIIFVEMVATVAALDGVALTAIQHDEFENQVEVTLTLTGPKALVETLAPMIEANAWPT